MLSWESFKIITSLILGNILNKTIVIIILILAFFIRFYNLWLLPLNHDEVTWTLGSIDNFDKFLKIPVACFYGYIQPLYSYLVIFTKKFYSLPEYIIRIPAVIFGVFTVLLVYYLAKEMYGKRTGLISAMVLCFLPWHVIQSRIGVSLILTPFFGCLIFYALIKSIHKKSNIWFVLSWLFLGIGSFYTYQASLFFIPIFLATLLFLRKELSWVKPNIISVSLLIFLAVLYPLIHLQISGRINLLGIFYRSYQDNPFKGNISINLFRNLKTNTPIAFESLFFTSHGRILYGAALESPLFINWVVFFIIFIAVIISIRHRKVSDKIVLAWFGLGYLGGLSGINFFQPRYIVIALVPTIILLSKFISEVFSCSAKKTFLVRILLLFTGIFLWSGLIYQEVLHWVNYYHIAPTHLEECRRNSYGSQEAAQFLSKMPDIKNCRVTSDARMTTDAYLKYYRGKNKENSPSSRCTYYLFWAPQSHPKEYWNGLFWYAYQSFKQTYPKQTPIRTIYYPDGLAAINIFKIEEAKY